MIECLLESIGVLTNRDLKICAISAILNLVLQFGVLVV